MLCCTVGMVINFAAYIFRQEPHKFIVSRIVCQRVLSRPFRVLLHPRGNTTQASFLELRRAGAHSERIPPPRLLKKPQDFPHGFTHYILRYKRCSLLLKTARSCSLLLILFVGLHVFANELADVCRLTIKATSIFIQFFILWIKRDRYALYRLLFVTSICSQSCFCCHVSHLFHFVITAYAMNPPIVSPITLERISNKNLISSTILISNLIG